MEYKLIRSKRKTIAIKVSLDKGIEVRAPLMASDEDIDKVIKQNNKWIRETYEKVIKQGKEIINRKYETGEKLYFLGEERDIEIKTGNKCTIAYKEEKFIFTMEKDIIDTPHKREYMGKALYEAYLRKVSKVYLEERTRCLAEIYGFEVNKITIKNVKTRWGSCSSKKNINFNLKLMMAHKEAIDYVIIHELCHTKEMNHSHRFWVLVESIMPDYNENRKYLKSMSIKFNI